MKIGLKRIAQLHLGQILMIGSHLALAGSLQKMHMVTESFPEISRGRQPANSHSYRDLQQFCAFNADFASSSY